MAKQDRTDRQAVIDSIRKQQKGAEKRRGLAVVGVSALIAVLIVGTAAFQPLKDWWDLRRYSGAEVAQIGAPAEVCGEITTKKASGNQDHVPTGTPVSYEDAPPAFGQHYDVWDSIERKLYTTSDRPAVAELVHNLEHGFTVMWYDEKVAADDALMDDLRGLASKFADNDNLRNKVKIVPWTDEDGEAFPGDQHVALTHWSVGGAGQQESGEQLGVFQYCSAPSGAALESFMEKYPYLDSPEPDAV